MLCTIAAIIIISYQSVYNYPHEQPRRKVHRHCRDDWYAHHQAVCGYAHDSAGERIFDSQVTITAKSLLK